MRENVEERQELQAGAWMDVIRFGSRIWHADLKTQLDLCRLVYERSAASWRCSTPLSFLIF